MFIRAARFYTFFDFSFWVVIKSGEMVRKYDMQKHFALSLYLQVAHLGQNFEKMAKYGLFLKNHF